MSMPELIALFRVIIIIMTRHCSECKSLLSCSSLEPWGASGLARSKPLNVHAQQHLNADLDPGSGWLADQSARG